MKSLWPMLVLCCSVLLLKAQKETDYEAFAITSQHFDLRPAWSADGKSLLFTSDRKGFNQLFILNLDNDSIEQRTSSFANNSNGAWHPSGNAVVFDTDISGKNQLFLLDLEHGIKSRLINREIETRYASFNVEANLLVFLGKEPNDKSWNLYTYDFIYNNLNKLTKHQTDCYYPAWSPDGAYISYHLNEKNGKYDANVIHWYGQTAFEPALNNEKMHAINWSPNGYRIVYVTEESLVYRLYSSRRDGSEAQLLFTSQSRISEPAWSPDGSTIAFCLRISADEQQIWLLKLE